MGQLGCGTIFISAEGQCHKIMIGHTSAYTQLESNQPEADTRLILHARDALQSTTSDVYIYSPSADTDIIVLAVSLLHDESHRVYIADGSGKGLKTFKLSDVTIDDEELRRKHGVTVEEEELSSNWPVCLYWQRLCKQFLSCWEENGLHKDYIR